jgi:nucleotidyltransferase/DNA polymerase involved in DNA repair
MKPGGWILDHRKFDRKFHCVAWKIWSVRFGMNAKHSTCPAAIVTLISKPHLRALGETEWMAVNGEGKGAEGGERGESGDGNVGSMGDGKQSRALTAGEDPSAFVNRFFKNSRLHFIGTWKQRYSELLQERPPNPPLPSPPPGCDRTIAHCDMDAFFASASACNRPDLRNTPIAVAWGSGEAAEVSSCNYQARALGVTAGMPMRRAKELAPHIEQLQYDFELYTQIATTLYQTLWQLTPHVQGMSCDEAFLDLTGFDDPDGSMAWLRQAVKERTGCTCSVGIGPNQLLASIATKHAKPDGQKRVEHEEAKALLGEESVERLPGIASKIRKQLNSMGIHTCRNLQNASKKRLKDTFGQKCGVTLHELAHGIDNRRWEEKPQRRSVGAQCSWGVRFSSSSEVQDFLDNLGQEVSKRLGNANVKGRTVSIQLMRQVENAPEHARKGALGHGVCDSLSRSMTLANFTDSANKIASEAKKMVHELDVPADQVRGLGIQVTRLNTEKGSESSGTTGRAKVSAAGKRSCYSPQTSPGWARTWLDMNQQNDSHQSSGGARAQQQRSLSDFAKKCVSSSASRQASQSEQQPDQREMSRSNRRAYQMLNSLDEIDPEVLKQLPGDVQDEVKAELQQNSGKQKRRQSKNRKGGPMDSFVKSGGKKAQKHGSRVDEKHARHHHDHAQEHHVQQQACIGRDEEAHACNRSEREENGDAQSDVGENEEEKEDHLAIEWEWNEEDEIPLSNSQNQYDSITHERHEIGGARADHADWVLGDCEGDDEQGTAIAHGEDEEEVEHDKVVQRKVGDEGEDRAVDNDEELMEQAKAETASEFWKAATEEAALMLWGVQHSEVVLEPYTRLAELAQERIGELASSKAKKELLQHVQALGAEECESGAPGSRWSKCIASAVLTKQQKTR